MKKLLFILLFILSFTLIQGQNYYDTDPTKYEAPGDSTQYYVLGIFRIGSDPGGWENRNTFWIDSLFNSLVVYTDTSQLFIRNDTLFISESFLTSAIDSVNFDTINATYINATHMLAQAIQTDTLKVDWIDSITTEIIKTDVVRFDSVNVATTHQQGKMEYDSTSHSVVYYTEEPDITMNIGRELWIRVYNNSGVTIPNGSAVYPTGAVAGGWGTVALAQADSDATSNVIGLATHSIENNTFGYITRFGDVRGMNTIGLTIGATAYLSADTAGRPTTTIPQAPNNAIALGGVTSVGATGSMFALIERFNPINGEAAIGFQDSTYEITPIVQNDWYRITNDANDLYQYNTDVGHDITLSGDTLYCAEAGVYEFIMSFSFSGANGGIWEFAVRQNGTFVPDAKAVRKTGTADIGNVAFACKPRLTDNTPVTFWVRNTGNTVTPTFTASTIIVRQVR